MKRVKLENDDLYQEIIVSFLIRFILRSLLILFFIERGKYIEDIDTYECCQVYWVYTY